MSTDYHSTLPSRSERRERRESRKTTFNAGHFIIVGVVLALIGGVGAYSYYAYFTSTTEYRIEQAFEFIDNADTNLARINAVIDGDITDDTEDKVKESLELIEPTRDHLREAANLIKKAQEGAASEDEERLAAIKESIALRGQLLALAPEVLEVTARSAVALSGVTVGWEKLIEATTASASAAAAYENLDKAGMLDAVKYSNAALDALARARVEFNDAERALEGLSFKTYIDYIDIREQMAEAAIKMANDWTNDDQTALKIDMATYNELLLQAQAMEDNDLVPPSDIVAARYQALVGTQNADYLAIRDQIAALDVQVR